METDEVQYRAARPEDLPAILALFERTFGPRRSAQRWTWQYEQAAAGAGHVHVAEADGVVVGCVGLMAHDLNHLGTRVPAGQGCDAMLEDRFRSGGHFARLGLRNYQDAMAAGLNLAFAFPNHNSFATTIRDLGHERIRVLGCAYRRLGVRQLDVPVLRRAVHGALGLGNRVALAVLETRIGRGFELESTHALPQDLEPLLRSARNREVISIWKDEAYLRWRYERHPESRYAFHVLRRGGKPIALSVVREDGAVASVCELLNPSRSLRECSLLLRLIARSYSRRCHTLEFFGADAGFLESALAEAGFRGVRHSSLVLTAHVLREHPASARAMVPGNWSITYGDADVA